MHISWRQAHISACQTAQTEAYLGSQAPCIMSKGALMRWQLCRGEMAALNFSSSCTRPSRRSHCIFQGCLQQIVHSGLQCLSAGGLMSNLPASQQTSQSSRWLMT